MIRIGRTLLVAAFFAASTIAQESAPEKISFTTLKGKEYKDVEVTRVAGDSITVMHSGGIARLDFADLPEEVQKKFGFDPNKADAARKANTAQQQAIRSKMAARQKAVADATQEKALLESAERETFKILQADAEGGALANIYRRGGRAPGSLAGAISTISGRSSEPSSPSVRDLVFLTGKLDPTLIDESILDAVVVPDGSYKYTDVQGATRTVAKYRVLEMKIDKPQ